MLLFSTLLNIKPTMTKQDFIDLVFEWNRTSTYEENIIPNLVWNGEQNIRYGNNKVWLNQIENKTSVLQLVIDPINNNVYIPDLSEKTTDYLLKYCELDTYAMVKVLQRLEQIVE